MNVKVKKLTNTCKLPTYGSECAACADLYADCPDESYEYTENAITHKGCGIAIKPNEMTKISTGLSIQPENGYYAQIFARSGMATKKGLRLSNDVGIIDEDYRGPVIVALYNDSNQTQVVQHGDRIAQILFEKYEQVNFIETDVLDDTERGSGGFGSTGVK